MKELFALIQFLLKKKKKEGEKRNLFPSPVPISVGEATLLPRSGSFGGGQLPPLTPTTRFVQIGDNSFPSVRTMFLFRLFAPRRPSSLISCWKCPAGGGSGAGGAGDPARPAALLPLPRVPSLPAPPASLSRRFSLC